MDSIIGIIILAALAVCIVLLIVLITKQGSVKTIGDIMAENQKTSAEAQNRRLDDMSAAMRRQLDDMSAAMRRQLDDMSAAMRQQLDDTSAATRQQLENMSREISDKQGLMNANVKTQIDQLENRFKTFETTNEQKLNGIRETVSKHLNYIQDDNNKKLDEIRNTVDEKLQKTLDEKMTNSFKLVSERLEQVYKGLGEMQSIASGVGDLKKVLSNVKTRGILGEIQLGAILSEILNSEQYDTEVAVKPGGGERVEFAVKLPARDGGEYIYLPIDSKFPGDTYGALQEAYAEGDPDAVKEAYKALETVIKKSAKDIRDKYICPPYTTNFAIMFLPFEGLYAEVVNHGLVEVLQREYSVNIAGPSTMAAMLNSLQMGFKTLQIQKRSDEVWKVLGAVKKEFETFEGAFANAQKRIRQLDEEMEKLVGTRTRAIQRKLREVETVSLPESDKILEIEDER